jgi:hypothetical protein
MNIRPLALAAAGFIATGVSAGDFLVAADGNDA